LTGQYPAGIIDWGSSGWYLSSAYAQFLGNSISFNGPGPTSGNVTFVTPRKLVQLDAYNGGTTSGLISLSCKGQPTKQQRLAPGQAATIVTGWATPCTSVTIGSSNGWFTNFNNVRRK
jgi:hypothetical protein